jgi:HAMP domain-containing protein
VGLVTGAFLLPFLLLTATFCYTRLIYALILWKQLQEEVVSESSENSVDSLTQGEGNLTMAELASSLMQKRQTEETETTEEESEPVAENLRKKKNQRISLLKSRMNQMRNQMSRPYNLQMFFQSLKTWTWIHYPRRSLRNLAKHLNASAIKRFGKLTAQKKALLAENQESPSTS